MTRRVGRRLLCAAVLALITVLAAAPAFAAETVHLVLKIDGQVVKGESTQTSLGRDGTIECTSFEQAVVGTDSGKQYTPVRCVKRIDKSSPLLVKALIEKRPVEAQFLFFRPNPTGDGTTQQFYTITLTKARITGYRIWVPDTLNPASSNWPPMEEVLFTYEGINWNYNSGNVTYGDTWRSGRSETAPADQAASDPGLKADVKGQSVGLSWNAVTAPKGKTLAGYNVYRSTDASKLFTAENRLNDFMLTRTSISDTAPVGTHYYGLQAVWTDQSTTEYQPPLQVRIQ